MIGLIYLVLSCFRLPWSHYIHQGYLDIPDIHTRSLHVLAILIWPVISGVNSRHYARTITLRTIPILTAKLGVNVQLRNAVIFNFI